MPGRPGRACQLWTRTERSSTELRPPLFDHLVGTQDKPGRNLMPDRLCGFEIDGQFEVGPLLDGQIGRSCAAE
jgi:hypothetical protein